MLPSKKIIIALSILILIIGGSVWYVYGRGSTTVYENTNQNFLSISSSSNEINTLSQKDSDNDGLADWEEALHGTNPNKPDTDGDGTTDGKEVELERNPLIKGPKDSLVQKTNAATSDEKENLTLTDVFARNLFTKYIEIQQSGQQITTENAEAMAADYLKNTTLPTISTKKYTTSDLKLVDSNKSTTSTYRDTITAIFAKYWPSNQENELSVFQQSFTNGDEKALAKLGPIITAYQNILNNSLVTPVPKLAVSLHTNMLDSISTYIQTLKMIQVSYTDPLSGLVGLNAQQTNQINMLIAINNLRTYFTDNLQ